MYFNLIRKGTFVAIAAVSAGAAHANLLSDGSFESVGAAYATLDTATTLSAGNTYGAWTVSGVNVSVLGSGYAEPSNGMTAFNSEDGSYAMDLTGPSNTGNTNAISQSATTVIGKSYTVSFWVGTADSSTNSGFYNSPSVAGVAVNGGSITNFTNSNFATRTGNVSWQQFSYSFVATSTSSNVSFFNENVLTNNYCGLDNVDLEVTPAPEPCSTLFALSLVGYVGRRLRRK